MHKKTLIIGLSLKELRGEKRACIVCDLSGNTLPRTAQKPCNGDMAK